MDTRCLSHVLDLNCSKLGGRNRSGRNALVIHKCPLQFRHFTLNEQSIFAGIHPFHREDTMAAKKATTKKTAAKSTTALRKKAAVKRSSSVTRSNKSGAQPSKASKPTKSATKPAVKKAVSKASTAAKATRKAVAKKADVTKTSSKKTVAKRTAKRVAIKRTVAKASRAVSGKAPTKTRAGATKAARPTKRLSASSRTAKRTVAATAKASARRSTPARATTGRTVRQRALQRSTSTTTRAMAKQRPAKSSPPSKKVPKSPAKGTARTRADRSETKAAEETTRQRVTGPTMTPTTQPTEQPSPKPAVRYSDEELEEFRQIILAERDKTLDELRMLRERLEDLTNYETSEETGIYSMHMAEQGSEAYEREKTYAQIQRMTDYLRKLDEALKRIDDKTYGICRMCGILIAKERLRAVPITTLSASWKLRGKCPEDGIDRVGPDVGGE